MIGSLASRRYGWALATPLVTLLLALLLNSITSRSLAPEGFGQFAVMVGFMTLLSAVIGLGMPVTVVRFSAGVSDVDDRDRYRMAAWTLVISAGCLVLIMLLTLDASSSDLLDRWISHGSALAVGAGAFGLACIDLAAAESQGQMAFHGYFGRLVAGSALRLLGVVGALALFQKTAQVAIAGYAIACLVMGVVLGARSLHRDARRATIGMARLRETIGRIARFGLPVLGSTVVVATIVYVDTLIVASTLAETEVGWYAAASRLTVVQSTLVAGLAALSLPVATAAVREGRVESFTSSIIRWAGGLGVVATLGLVTLSSVIVDVIHGSSFHPAAVAFAILSLGLLPNFIGNPLSQLLYAHGTPGRLLWVHIAQLAALIIGLPLVARAFGINGVAVLRSVVNVIAVGLVIWMALRWKAGKASEAEVVPPPFPTA